MRAQNCFYKSVRTLKRALKKAPKILPINPNCWGVKGVPSTKVAAEVMDSLSKLAAALRCKSIQS